MNREELLLFGERIRSRRKTLALTQEHVSNEIDVSLRFYQMVERGEKSVSLETLVRLSKALSVSADYLLFGGFPNGFTHPLAALVQKLTPRQQADAETILRIYEKACNGQEPS